MCQDERRLIPALLLITTMLRSLSLCLGTGLMMPISATGSCGTIPFSYYLLLAGFAIIACLGAGWPLLRWRRGWPD